MPIILRYSFFGQNSEYIFFFSGELSWTSNILNLNAQNNDILLADKNGNNLLSMNLDTRLTRDLNIEIPAKTQNTIFDHIGQFLYWSSKNQFHRISLQSGISQKMVGKTKEIIENFIINPIFNKNIYYVTINGNIGVFNAMTESDEPKIIETFCNTLVGPFNKFLGVDQNHLAFIEKSTNKIWFFHFKVYSIITVVYNCTIFPIFYLTVT